MCKILYTLYFVYEQILQRTIRYDFRTALLKHNRLDGVANKYAQQLLLFIYPAFSLSLFVKLNSTISLLVNIEDRIARYIRFDN